MVIDYSPQEQEQLKKINQKYNALIFETNEKASTQKNKKELTKLETERKSYEVQWQMQLDRFKEQCEKKRFAEIANDPVAIIKNAKEQIPLCLDDCLKDSLNPPETIDDMVKKGFIVKHNDIILLTSQHAAEYLMQELHLHFETFEKDTENFKNLFSLLLTEIRGSKLTTNEIVDTDKLMDAAKENKLRRNPLSDISYYGLMSDKANAQIIRDGIFKEKPNGQMMVIWAVNQAPKGKEEVPVYIALSYEGTENKLSKRLTAFDNAVYNAVSTRYYYWKLEHSKEPLYITPQEIWRTMNGKSSSDGTAKPSKAQVQRICDSLDKMRFTRFIMDINAEIKAYKLFIDDERVKGGIIDDYLLNSKKLEFETEKGRTVTGYKIGDEPILYTYNQAKKHILYVPFKMLDTSNHTSDSENVIEFKNYLLQQIQLMKNANESDKKGKFFKRNNRILIDSIYADTGIKTPEERAEESTAKTEDTKNSFLRKTRKKDREKIEGLLTAWTTENWIKGFNPVKDGQSIRGYDILF